MFFGMVGTGSKAGSKKGGGISVNDTQFLVEEGGLASRRRGDGGLGGMGVLRRASCFGSFFGV